MELFRFWVEKLNNSGNIFSFFLSKIKCSMIGFFSKGKHSNLKLVFNKKSIRD